jgi:hypothetical protein
LLIELLFFSSVSSTWLVLILCISIPYSGSRICSVIQFRIQTHLLILKSVFRFWMTFSHTLCIRTCADLCLRRISCFSHSCWQQRFCSVTTK